MSIDPSFLQRSGTPLSGRSTPVQRLRDKQNEEDSNSKDKTYRRYAAGVKQALASFETTQQDWADYISFLARIQKALQARPSTTSPVPYADSIATRLAQCLNPNLPSGVHQKALEVYTLLLSSYEGKSLVQQLHLFLPGLTPVLSFAALSVRPYFLAILDQHILPLGHQALRPTLKALILSLLPGLEDESTEDFERVVATLDRLRQDASSPEESSSPSFFWQCFFLATITSPSRRQGALAYLVQRLPSFVTPPSSQNDASTIGQVLSTEARAALSPEPGLLVRSFAAGLSDKQLLVQRGFLDLLISHLPLHSLVLQKVIPEADLQRLVSATLSVVLRRDMSLNRRLWQWLLGPERKEEEGIKSPTQDRTAHHAAYFFRFGLKALTDSILAMINAKSLDPIQRARPLRICLSLMDRWEVGGSLVPAIFVPAIQSVCEYSAAADKQDADEVIKSAGIFFDGVESALIWGKFLKMLLGAIDYQSDAVHSSADCIRFCDFIVQKFNLREEEMTELHIPLVLLAVISRLQSSEKLRSGLSSSSGSELSSALEAMGRLAMIVTKKPTEASKTSDRASIEPSEMSDMANRIQHYFEKEQQGLAVRSPVAQDSILSNVLSQSLSLFEITLQSDAMYQSIPSLGQIICTLVQKLASSNTAVDLASVNSFFQRIAQLPTSKLSALLPSVLAIVQVSSTLQEAMVKDSFEMGAWNKAQHTLINVLWDHLDPCEPKYHVEAVRCLLMLDGLARDQSPVESVITAHLLDAFSTDQKLSGSNRIDPIEAIRRFNVLWIHAQQEKTNYPDRKPSLARSISKLSINGLGQSQELLPLLAQPLLVILDRYEEASKGVAAFIRDWLHMLPGQSRIYEMLITRVSCLNTVTRALPSKASHHLITSMDDTLLCLHLTRHILGLLEDASEQTWLVIAQDTMRMPESFTVFEVNQRPTLQFVIMAMCLELLDLPGSAEENSTSTCIPDIQETALLILQTLLRGPYAAPLSIVQLEVILLERLKKSIDAPHFMQQRNILRAITLALNLPRDRRRPDERSLRSPISPTYSMQGASSLKIETSDTMSSSRPPPPPLLIECLKLGFSSTSSQRLVDDWVEFLVEVLPMYAETIFQNLIPLVECFCKQIKQTFVGLRDGFATSSSMAQKTPETTLISLITGLEQILAKAHGRLVTEEEHLVATKSPEQPQGFLGSITQGVFSTEAPSKARTVTANSRLTVILCFQDAVRTCYEVWRWDQNGSAELDGTSTASATYTSLRMRNRARRLLEHLFAAEALECLETLIVLWQDAVAAGTLNTCPVIPLLNVLTGASPKLTIPAIFNALYSRTNPSALEPSRLSSLTSDLTDEILIRFLISYTQSVDDDSMDEIWSDCVAFMRDVLANPLPHRQILPLLLYFLAEIANKVDNTNFGEQKKMRKELVDHFLRLLAATFTTRPQGLSSEGDAASTLATTAGKPYLDITGRQTPDALSLIAAILPQLPSILIDADRVTTAAQSISTNIIAPAIKSKNFPTNVGPKYLEVLLQMTKLSQASKFWRKDIADALNDSRFFFTRPALLQSYWLLIVKQFNMHEKDRMTELLGRLTPPTTAGIVFGVGATSARLDTDRKTSLVLRRIALTILSSPTDTFVSHLGAIEEKLVEIFSATPTSSPSTSIWADTLLLLRVILLKVSGVHVAPLWPLINKETQSAFLSIVTEENDTESRYNNAALLQACKLLDTLIGIGTEEFQIYEWLYVTDTIDAVYRRSDSASIALADEIAEVLGSTETSSDIPQDNGLVQTVSGTAGSRRLLFDSILEGLSEEYDTTDLRTMSKGELSQRVLRPYFGQLSLLSFEATYVGQMVDEETCVGSVISDLCDGGIGGE